MPARRMSNTLRTPDRQPGGQPPQAGAADHDGAGAEGKGLDDVAAAPDAAVEQHLGPTPTAAATAGSARIEAEVPSRLLPPWLETEIAVAPASTARRARPVA